MPADQASPSLYRGHRFPPEIISHAVWLYFRFSVSFRDVEELMADPGIRVSYETVREWSAKFGPAYARELRRQRPRPSDKWHPRRSTAQDQGQASLAVAGSRQVRRGAGHSGVG